MITDPAASASSPPGKPTPLTVLPPSDPMSTRTRRRTTDATDTAPAAVEHGFMSGGAPRPSIRRAITPPRVPRPQPPPAVFVALTSVASPVPTVPISSNCDRAELVGTPRLRLSHPTGVSPVTTTDLDALGAAAKFQFGDSAARYSHPDWGREQQAEPARNAAMRYIAVGRREALPAEFFVVFRFSPATSFSFRRFRS